MELCGSQDDLRGSVSRHKYHPSLLFNLDEAHLHIDCASPAKVLTNKVEGHLAEHVASLCRDNLIAIHCPPSHTTSILQPLDKYGNAIPMKNLANIPPDITIACCPPSIVLEKLPQTDPPNIIPTPVLIDNNSVSFNGRLQQSSDDQSDMFKQSILS
ncbi:hypothetical protein BLNAU_4399 [Blattamonas nauphoetae]|uniref:Uncharacterized protein n=1 Tax=Blattamonas nauphoetae TaxID=2049346 RepID=A0ABQ9Y9Y3_9EUKA|nr:hypothetical protein BLNAU_4399 [Blattamonas nauphoetae]